MTFDQDQNNVYKNNDNSYNTKNTNNLNDVFKKYIREKDLVKKKESTNASIYFFLFLIIALITVWFCSGFYIVKESEKGIILRFGKFIAYSNPGLNWIPMFIDNVTIINVESIKELSSSGSMLTSDSNIIYVEMNVQYRISNLKNYLFSSNNPEVSLQQAIDSALRSVVGKYTMDKVLTEGRTIIKNDTKNILKNIMIPYKTGLSLLDVNLQTARPPKEVKYAFDNAISAKESEQQYIREAEAYSNEIKPLANGKAKRIIEEGKSYKSKSIIQAEGEVRKFKKILPQYILAPKITRERLYIDAMSKILSKTNKVFVDDSNNKLFILPLYQMLKNGPQLINNISKNQFQPNTNNKLLLNKKNNTKHIISKVDNNSYIIKKNNTNKHK
ncbi:MAG: FtsH protease activity modulator HflK [Enterobacterales bacterium]